MSGSPGLAVLWVGAALGVGVYAAAVMKALSLAAAKGPVGAAVFAAPLREAAWLMLQQRTETERPDAIGWRLAPPLYLALAAGGLALMPLSQTRVPVEAPAGIVWWGAMEALAIVAIFLHGWSANAWLPLVGAYRQVALGLSILLVSMFVLIGAALPAESMRFSDIVASQRELWNLLRQPLGLPLLLCVATTLAFSGPFDFADSADLAGGTSADTSGPPRLVWRIGRAAMLVAFSALAATLFLGGWMGPLLPGPLWLALKTLVVLALLVALDHLAVRISTERAVALAWLVLLPLSFLHLVLAGLEALA